MNNITAGVCEREDANRTREVGTWMKSKMWVARVLKRSDDKPKPIYFGP